MSNSLYEHYFAGDSNEKGKEENNFDIGSFDANNTMNEHINSTINSGKKEEENNSNKFINSVSKFQEKDKIPESDEQNLENSKINTHKFCLNSI